MSDTCPWAPPVLWILESLLSPTFQAPVCTQTLHLLLTSYPLRPVKNHMTLPNGFLWSYNSYSQLDLQGCLKAPSLIFSGVPFSFTPGAIRNSSSSKHSSSFQPTTDPACLASCFLKETEAIKHQWTSLYHHVADPPYFLFISGGPWLALTKVHLPPSRALSSNPSPLVFFFCFSPPTPLLASIYKHT